MTPRHRATLWLTALTALSAAGASACETVVEDDGLGEGTSDTVIVDDTPPPTSAAPTGTTEELLVEITSEMSQLGSRIAEGDGDDESYALIVELWTEIEPDVAAAHPELVRGMARQIELAAVAVDRTRPADADKSFWAFSEFVDVYVGDG